MKMMGDLTITQSRSERVKVLREIFVAVFRSNLSGKKINELAENFV